jgi:hypothetical protein
MSATRCHASSTGENLHINGVNPTIDGTTDTSRLQENLAVRRAHVCRAPSINGPGFMKKKRESTRSLANSNYLSTLRKNWFMI